MAQSRRYFLLAAGAAAGTTLRAFGANDQIGFGFIGSGIRGTILLHEFQSLPGIRPVAVADLYDGYLLRAKEQTGGKIDTTKDYRAVIGHKDVDVVVIATPDHWHTQLTVEALQAGKHVYIEKPMTWSIEEGPKIIAAVKKSGKVLQVGSETKTEPPTLKAREIVASGVLGKIDLIRMVNNRNTPEGAWEYPIPPDASEQTIDWPQFLGRAPKRAFDPKVFCRWRCWWEYSGGVATDLFVHQLTMLHEVMNVKGPSSVVSQGGIYRWNDGRTVPDMMESSYDYGGAFQAYLCVNLSCGFREHGMVIQGSEATLVQDGERLTLYPEPRYENVQRYGSSSWPKAMRAKYFDEHGWSPDGRPLHPPPPRKNPEEIKYEPGPSHYEYFLKSLRDGLPSQENEEDGHFAAGAAHLANLAYRRGRRVRWDLETNQVSEG
ncbi:MAG: Gfo/Idh/MocA family protein [Bryobacteraceae bacterium]